jgi:hypothetical protein
MLRDVWVIGVLRDDDSLMEIIFPVTALDDCIRMIQTRPHIYMERRNYEKPTTRLEAGPETLPDTAWMHEPEAAHAQVAPDSSSL